MALLRRISAALGLNVIFESGCLTVMGDDRGTYVQLPDHSGLIWGTLFDRITSWRVDTSDDFKQPFQTNSDILSRYWGGYLSIRHLGDATQILRDPSGAIACYFARIDGAFLFTNRPALLVDGDLVKAEIDWTLLSQSLAFRNLRVPRTCLRGIDELMPGTEVTIDRSEVRVRTAWSPWGYAMTSQDLALNADAIERVQRVVTNCVGAWGRCFARPILELSGGLDSSIVAAAMARGGSPPVCATFAPTEGDPDETPYAKAAADHLGLRLEVLPVSISDVDITRSLAKDLPRPSTRAFAQAQDTQLRALAAREKADAFFSGGGGDNVFALLRSVLPVIDRWKHGGGVFATIADIAGVAEVNFWKVLTGSVARAIRLRQPRQWSFDPSFLAPSSVTDLPFPHGHPWLSGPAMVYPGKRVHVRSLLLIQNFLEGFSRLQDAPIIFPLLSQPVVETCLAIPTWVWCEGGIDRAVARRAFKDRLPPLLLERKSKGSFDSYAAAIFETNRASIREMLLDGILSSQGLLDINRIESALDGRHVGSTELLRLLDLIDVEAWAMAWTSRAHRSGI